MPRLSKVGAAALAAFGWTGGASVSASYLVVAGGGGGGKFGGGGGAGGYLASTISLNPTVSYSVTVGAGGVGSTGSNFSAGTSGSNSVFSSVTSIGGGAGTGTGNGVTGGSGGGVCYQGSGAAATGGSATSGQGNVGGNALTNVNGTSGGGGAGAAGSSVTNANGGNGGNGSASSISGTSVTYAGGGGGACDALVGGSTNGTGGTGGGGAGNQNAAGTAGTANLGGGGGGGGRSSGSTIQSGGNGGSGVVIISYLGAQQFGGGNVTSVGGNTIHTFTTSGTLSPLSSLTAQYLIVAGGGGSGTNTAGNAGGGGAGGLLTGTGVTIDTNSNYVVVVGAGGAAYVNGGNSSWSMVTTTAVGGGKGGYYNMIAAGSGGSGGGAGQEQNSGAAGTSGQGNAGGTSGYGGGGGGGAGAAGGNATGGTPPFQPIGGTGGIGVASSISGTSTYYAGGGGGSNHNTAGSQGGIGGLGGGGNGHYGATAATAGTAGTGGGAGGAGENVGGTAPSGGSGVVIIAYPGSTQQMAGGTVTISGGNVIHTFTSSGYLTPIKYASRSLRFRSSATAYLSKTPTVSGNTTTFTYSVWAKRGSLSSTQYLFWGGNNCNFGFGLIGTDDLGGNLRGTGATNYFFNTSGVFRDPSAWYHIVWAVDTTQATDTNRLKLYVNGVQQTLSVTYPPQNTVELSTAQRNIGSESARYYYDGYLTEINFIDGAALTPSSFGTFNSYGVWQPITYGGSYGTNGFYLTFGNNTSTTTLGYDTSPQGNNWTTNNISLTAGATYDSMLDVPTLTSATVANYPTLNPLFAGTSSYLSGGNLNASISAANTSVVGTFQIPSSGKWYWEYQITTIAGSSAPMGGIATTATNSPSVFYRTDGTKIVDGTNTAYGATYTTTDTIGVAVDVGGGTITFYKNNTSQGAITYASSAFYPALRSNVATDGFNINFGQRPFTYTAPTGFVALNTYNLSTPTIPNGAVYMAATTYTGTGASLAVANTVNGTAMQPDFVWIKSRSNAYNNELYDVLRGVQQRLISNLTNAESTSTTALTAFNSNGFTQGGQTETGANGATYVAWQWKANGTGVSNTSGSITSTVSAGTTQGFSVVTYTGTGAAATVGHGLGAVPSMIIVKKRSGAGTTWAVYNVNIGAANSVSLNSTAASSAQNYWNSTTPTSSVWSMTGNAEVNGSAETYVAYVFAAVAGYSAFGSYTGNGSTDGPFVFLGFRPRFILVKSSTSVTNWNLIDTARDSYNTQGLYLFANSSAAEGSTSYVDILSNGFKLRNAGGGVNGSGDTYIYYAVAENPFKYSNAR